ncbi:type II toxin-antitoxin system RelE family toxin [Micromonospora sp. LOL_023]|uniref:type II toxin-antitoxin system RelE family toxin n=1 Tax=Micromonospora sp. LOL_023 TaxID=3345418 RepID=UPI003A84630B
MFGWRPDDPAALGPSTPALRRRLVGRRGDYRVLYEIDDEQRVVTVTAVEHRGGAYRSR